MTCRKNNVLICSLATIIIICSPFQTVSQTSSEIVSDVDFVHFILQNILNECSVTIIYNGLNNHALLLKLFADINQVSQRDHFLWKISESTLTLNENSKLNFSGDKLNDFHQRRKQCSVALFSLNIQTKGIISDFVDNISKLIYSFHNIIRSDSDYFIFHTPLELLDQLLLNAAIAQKVKHKVGVVNSEGTDSEIILRSICYFCKNGDPLTIDLDWRNSKTLEAVFPNFLKDFHKKKFKISTPTECKWLTEISYDSQLDKWIPKRGIYNRVIISIQEKLNFTLEFFPSMGGGGTGSRLKNGSWNGIVGDLLAGTADLGQAAGQTLSRIQVIDYSFPVTYEWLTFTTGQPQPFYTWKSIYRPLSFETWIFLFGFFSFMVLVFLGFFKISPIPQTKNMSLKIILRFLFTALIEQSEETLTSTDAPFYYRILCQFWLIFILVISTAYKSKLISFLAFPNVEIPPDSFESLAYSRYSIVLQYTGAAYSLFKTSTNPTYLNIFKRMKIEKSEVACFEKALNSRAGCISWANIVDYISYRNISDIHGRTPLAKAPAAAYFLVGGILMPKRSIFKKEFSNYIKQAMDTGLISKWKMLDAEFVINERSLWMQETNRTQNNYFIEHSDVLTNKHLSGSFYLLCVGIVISSCAFIIEFVITKWKKTKTVSFN